MRYAIAPTCLLAAVPLVFAQTPPPVCAAFPSCLYIPAINSTTVAGSPASFSYRDAAGEMRTIDLYVRVPGGETTGALPVVIWSPPTAAVNGPDASGVMALWSSATAAAGYLTITVRHSLRDRTRVSDICARLRLEDDVCVAVGLPNWDWPSDLRQLLNWIETANSASDSPLRGRIDMRRIAVAGHAEGGNAAISLAGAKRLLTTQDRRRPNEFTDARPAIFLALSPQGPQFNGFYDYDLYQPNHSWMDVARPVLMATSDGDNTCRFQGQCAEGDTPSRRRIAFELLPAGGKHLLHLKTAKCSHDLIGTLDTGPCTAAGIDPQSCANYAAWLRASVLAFLDAHLLQRQAAQEWLRQGAVAAASGNVAEGKNK